jgi:hypothetical protein
LEDFKKWLSEHSSVFKGKSGDSMSYLQAYETLLIVCGRNDEECKNKSNPFLEGRPPRRGKELRALGF